MKNEQAPIQLEVIESVHPVQDHFLIRFSQPGRVEIVRNFNGDIVAHVYGGYEIDTEQEPEGAYDSTVESVSWESDVDEWTVAMWRVDLEDGKTTLSYWDWVKSRRAEDYSN